MIHKLDLSMVVPLSEVIAQLRGNWTISSGGGRELDISMSGHNLTIGEKQKLKFST